MDNLAVEEIGDCGEADMRVRPHIEILAWRDIRWAHVIKKRERADHASFGIWQRAAHRESTDLTCTRRDNEVDRISHFGFVSLGGLGRHVIVAD